MISPKEYFYTRWMFGRIRDCWDRPICSTPGGQIELMERKIDCGRPWFMDDKAEYVLALNSTSNTHKAERELILFPH